MNRHWTNELWIVKMKSLVAPNDKLCLRPSFPELSGWCEEASRQTKRDFLSKHAPLASIIKVTFLSFLGGSRTTFTRAPANTSTNSIKSLRQIRHYRKQRPVSVSFPFPQSTCKEASRQAECEFLSKYMCRQVSNTNYQGHLSWISWLLEDLRSESLYCKCFHKFNQIPSENQYYLPVWTLTHIRQCHCKRRQASEFSISVTHLNS